MSYLIAPDLEHHISLHSWHTAFPTAQIIAPEGLAEKRAGSSTYAKQPIPIASTIKASEKDKIQIDQDFDREFDVELVDAHPNKELVFLHRPSKTLIQADLFFNLPAKEQYSKVSEGPEKGIFSKFANYLLSTTGEALPQRRFLWYVLTAKDRAGFNRSVKRIASWDFENVIGCHGDAVLGQGKEVFERVMRWHLDAPEKKKAA